MNTRAFRTVAWFEFRRVIAKRGFWAATLAVPVLYAILLALTAAQNTHTGTTPTSGPGTHTVFEYTDESGTVDPLTAHSLGGTPATGEDPAIAAVRDGHLDAYVHYPAGPGSGPIRVWARDLGPLANPQYTSLATALLQQSAAAKTGNPALAAALAKAQNVTTVAYRDGQPVRDLDTALPALVFFALFFVLVSVLSNHALNSVVEEKENRIAETLLLSVKPTAFILGKITAILAVAALQIAVFAAPVAIGYTAFQDRLHLPDLSNLGADPAIPIFGTLLLASGFALVTALLVALSAAVPTARDGAPYYSALMITLFAPLYAFTTVITDPHSPLTQAFLYFPPTTPITALLMNAFGTLTPLQGTTATAELTAATAAATALAVRTFSRRALARPTAPRNRPNV